MTTQNRWTNVETRNLQYWPRGTSYQYQGDPDGPADQKRLRVYNSNARGSTQAAWRKGTPAEWREIRIELRAEVYGRNEINGCDSALVGDLIKAAQQMDRSQSDMKDLSDGFSYEEIRNIYKDPSDWDAETCRDYANEHGLTLTYDPWTMPRGAIIGLLIGASIECRDEETIETLREALIVNVDDGTIEGLDEWRDTCREHAQDNPAEVYEWWRVDSWLCDQLHAIGEVTIDNGYGHWWGRTCSGQMWIMDGTLQEIAAKYEREIEAETTKVRRAERAVLKT